LPKVFSSARLILSGFGAHAPHAGSICTFETNHAFPVLHELAAEFNALSGHYREVLIQLAIKTRELSTFMDDLEMQPPVNAGKETAAKISERVDEIRGLLGQIKL
jgi:hypothetical protein